MINKKDIIALLQTNKQLTDYEISIVDKDSRELFYVLKHLEINRAVKVNKTIITVYVSNKNTTGSSTVTVTAADDKKSLKEKIAKAVKKAKQARNEYYPLVEKTKNIKESKNAKRNLNDIANNVAKAVFKADKYRKGWINSTEIFVSEYRKEFINSKGVNHVSNSFTIEVECIPTWSENKEEFELYKYYKSSKIDYASITKQIDDILKSARNRSVAKTIKDVKLPKDLKVLVKDDMINVLVNYGIVYDRSYQSVYTKQNHWNKKDVVSNTAFDLTMKPVINGCSDSSKFDGHGVVLKAKKLIKDGIVVNNFGGLQFGHYLKEKNITGELRVCQLDTKGSDSYKKQKHLIIDMFSAPQLEEDSGYWGGEVRLARYFDGKKYIPLTGLSISGNIYEDLKNVEFSKELDSSNCYHGPKYMIFKDIKIS